MQHIPPRAGELTERARKLAEVYRAEAAASEEAREPSPAAVEAMVDSGLLALMVPERFGGDERDLGDFLEVGLVLGEADASLAWVTTFLIEHNWWFAQCTESFQEEVFADGPNVRAAGVIAPTGRATPVDGGYRMTGRWGWASGSPCSDWLFAGALLDAPEPEILVAAFPMEDVERLDTWYVDGMCGTGSGDVAVDDAFVPADRTVPFSRMLNGAGPGADVHAGPLYHTPALPILMTAVASTAVGRARGALALYREEVATKVRGMGPPEREKGAVQARIGRCDTELAKAELLLRRVVAEVESERASADRLTRFRWMAWFGEASHIARGVVLDLSKSGGASAHFRSHPLQRAARDLNTLAAHVALDQDTHRENIGRLLMGLEVSSFFV